MKSYRITGFLLLLLTLSPPVFGETYFAKQNGVSVTSEKSPMSKNLYTLKIGEAVNVIQTQGKHFKIQLADGRQGWVFQFKLSAKKPDGAAGESNLLSGLTGESSVSAREAKAEGSIRGLKKVSKDYASGKKIDSSHIQSVEKMEKYSIKEEELIIFKKEGSIGEFSN